MSPVARSSDIDLVEGIARLALALEHEPLAVGRPVAFAGALAFDGQPPDAGQEVALLVSRRVLHAIDRGRQDRRGEHGGNQGDMEQRHGTYKLSAKFSCQLGSHRLSSQLSAGEPSATRSQLSAGVTET